MHFFMISLHINSTTCKKNNKNNDKTFDKANVLEKFILNYLKFNKNIIYL